MITHTWNTLSLMAFCGALVLAQPLTARADETASVPFSYKNNMVTITTDGVVINKDEAGTQILITAKAGYSYEVLEDKNSGVLKLQMNDTIGYLSLETKEEVAVLSAEVAPQTKDSEELRQSVVTYALQFVGGRYRYGGSDPHTGVDCSGFTKYIMEHGAGITLSRSSTGQANDGRAISAEEMRPGDLLLYGSGRSINHVAMYIGNGQVVHSSTERTGIKTSPWNYKTPVKIVNVLGD